MKLAICGGPRTGKTTLADLVRGHTVRHTDDLIGKLDWSDASAEVSKWFDFEGPWVIEGVAVVRALRKWLEAHPTGKPCDRVVYLTEPYEQLTKERGAMAKGCMTVWRGSKDRISVHDELVRRGVEIQIGALPLGESGTYAIEKAAAS